MGHVPWHTEDDTDEEISDSIELLSAGIDIGTTTSHVMLSRLLATRQGSYSKYHVVDRQIEFEGEIFLTPYADKTTIDEREIEAIIEESYASAGRTPDDIDTGAVIVTGEASRKENAERISNLFSEKSGKFVCATAGPNLEALMAAHGSGAVDLSLEAEADILHVDIGGGTTKFASIVEGFVKSTGSLNVGARLVKFDGESVSATEHAAQKVANSLDFDLETASAAEIREVLPKRFAELIFEVAADSPSELAQELLVSEKPEIAEFDLITFSGGVAEYVYDRDPGYFGDLGPELGEEIRTYLDESEYEIAELEPGIRATAIGSTNHQVQVSGNTITISDRNLLPMRNIPMVPFVVDADDEDLVDTFVEKLDLYDVNRTNGGFAFGFHLHGAPNYEFLEKIVASTIQGWEQMEGDTPLVLAFESDVARTVGEKAIEKVDAPVISIDSVDLDQFGYIDIGEPLKDTISPVVPVTIKSLVFEG